MKNILGNFRLLSLVCVILTLSNCQVEENLDLKNQLLNDQLNYSIKNLTPNEIESNYQIVENLKKLTKNKNSPLGKTIPFNELGFIINTDHAKYIEKGKYNSYTFSTVQKGNENIKNVLFSINEMGEYDAFLVEYGYSKSELLNFSPDKMMEKTTITPINNISIKSLTAKSAPLWVCKYDYELIDTGDLRGWGNEQYEWVLIASSCVVINADIIADSNTTTGNGSATYTTSGSMTYAGGSGGIATTPTPSMYDQDELIKINLVKTKLNVGGQQSRFLDQNGQIAFEIYDFLTNNIFSEESIIFAREMLNQMIQKPNVFTSITPFLIEKQINDNQLNPCEKGVFTTVKNTTVCDIAQVLAKLDANKSVYNTIIKSEVAPSGEPAQTVWNSPYNYTIYISTDYNGKTKLFIAASMFHEMVHAYFMSIFDDYHNANPPNLNAYNDFAGLFHHYVTLKNPASINAADVHHQQMATDYADAIARTLQEYQTGIPVPLGTSPNQIYSDLAWSGLSKTPVFDVLFPAGSSDAQRILNRYAAEQTGHPIGQGTPQEQTQIGQPCN